MPNQGMQQPTQHPYHSMQGTSMDNLQHTQNTTVPNMSTADPNAQLFESKELLSSDNVSLLRCRSLHLYRYP